mgnify:CR=1 FL=1
MDWTRVELVELGKRKRKKKQKKQEIPHRHLLYSAAVQSPDTDLDFFERVYKRTRGERFRRLREDFCGTAAMACEWVERRKKNLAWGIGQPIFGAIAERFGDKRAIILGAIVYALGLVLSSVATTPGAHQLLEIFVGFGIAGTGFGVILAVIGRSASHRHRSLALGIATAAGSAGQVVGPPAADLLLRSMSWSSVFVIFAAAIIAVLIVLPLMRALTACAHRPMIRPIPAFTILSVNMKFLIFSGRS